MAASMRVYEIARDEGLPSATVLQRLQRAGLDVKTASSTVDQASALHALNPKRYPVPEGGMVMAQPTATVVAPPPPPVVEEPTAPAEPGKPKPRRPTMRRPTARRRPAEGDEAAATAAPAEAAPAAPPAPEPTGSVAQQAQAAVPPAPVPSKVKRPAPVAAPQPVAAEPEVAEPQVATEPQVAAEPEAPTPEPAPAPEPEPPVEEVTAAAPVAEAPAPVAAPAPPPAPREEPAPVQEVSAEPAAGNGARGRGKRRRVVIESTPARRGAPGPGRERRGPRQRSDERPDTPVTEVSGPAVEVVSGSTVKDVADALEVSTAQVIKALMGLGEMATITQSISDEAIELVAAEVGREVSILKAAEVAEREAVFEDDPADLEPRAPVVTVMGHVDHGKTSLLDAIRQAEVAAGEAGGITQHIGAYQVHHHGRTITFLDTPGHEAFTAMRARGAKITDVAVIVVAADDGVMPQTREAIDHARAAEVPFMVAINKIDREDANPDRVRQELSQQEVSPTEWGGTHEFVEVSAKERIGVDTLLETVLLVADADAEPRANPKAQASGTVIESRLDPGRGPVTTALVQRGTLRVGDVVLAGGHYGRVRAMIDHTGQRMQEAGPSMPAEVLGLDGVPDAGEMFRVVANEREARQAAGELSQRLRAEALANRRPVSLEDLFAQIKEGGLKELNLVIKADVQGSVGALEDALGKIDQSEVRLRVISTGVGGINESDVMLASASSAIIIGFNVRPRPEGRALAEREGVDIRTYRVIYRVIEDVTAALVGMLDPDLVEEVIGHLTVRTIFRSSRFGTIAGSYVDEGVVRRGAKVRLLRDGTVVFEGEIGSLRRFDDDAREVATGFECGVVIADYNDVKEDDEIEVFEVREVARTEMDSGG